MKEILLVRHAKSDWGHEFLHDIDRPLNRRGYEDAYRMSIAFKKKYKLPDLLISSTATRAISTAFIFARTFQFPEKNVLLNQSIYESSESNLLEIISSLQQEVTSIMLFGHNPGLTNLINKISDMELVNLPTCGIVSLSFESEHWKNITKQTGHFSFSEFPKDFHP